MGVATGGNKQDNSGPPQPSLLSEINDWMQQTGLVSSFGLGLKVIKKTFHSQLSMKFFCAYAVQILKLTE